MKHLLTIAIMLLSAGLALAATPPGAKNTTLHRVEVKKLTYQFEKSPVFNVDVDRPRKSDPRLWLMIEATLEVETTVKNKFIPELTATWRVVLNDKYAAQSRKPAVQLTGTITYQHIRTHDRTVQIVAYLHPDTVEMITGESSPSNQHIQAVAIEISGSNVSQLRDRREKLWKSVGSKEKGRRWWDNWTYKIIDRSIIPLTSTPFLPVWANHYPQVKPR